MPHSITDFCASTLTAPLSKLIFAPFTHSCQLANSKSFLRSRSNVISSAKCSCYLQAKPTALSFEVVLKLGNIALSFLSAAIGWGFGPQSIALCISTSFAMYVICSAVSSPLLISPVTVSRTSFLTYRLCILSMLVLSLGLKKHDFFSACSLALLASAWKDIA